MFKPKKIPFQKILFFVVIIVFIYFWLFDIKAAFSQEITTEAPLDCQGDRIEYSEGHNEIKIIGDVVVSQEDMTIHADKVIVYPGSSEVYASGDVVFYKGEEVFKADKVYYNFETKQGSLIHGDFKSGQIYGESETIKKISEKELQAIKGYVSTCDLDIPHYRIEAKRIKVYLQDKIVARNVFFYVGNVPIFYFPYYTHSLKENKPKVQVIPGHSKEWGYFVLTSWRYFFNERFKGWIRADWREKLGFGEGVDVEYNTERFGAGTLKTYYTQERKRGLREHVPAEKEKFRISLEHKWQVDNDTEAFAEYHRYEDQLFIKDYFYQDYVKDPLPTSYISVIRKRDHYTLSFLARKRVNHFRTIVEKLPEIKYNLNNYKLGDTRFYVTSELRFDNLNRKEAITGHDTDAIRFHTDNRLTYPTRLPGMLDWLEFTPYAGRIETYYSKDRNGTDRDFFRGAWYSGYNLTTRIFRIYDVEGDYLGVEVNKLRHIISPTVSYTYRHEPTAMSSKLGQFDEVDQLSRAKFYTFALENKLQTKWFKEENYDKEKVDLISLRHSVNFFPQIEGHQFSVVTNRLDIKPTRWLEFVFDANYDPYTRDFDIFNARMEAEKSRWRLALSSRYTKSTQYHEGILDASYTLSPKWTLGVYERFDFQNKELVEQEYSFKRDLHCWTAELIWNIQEGETIWLVFTPKAFPDFPIEWVTSYHAPKLGSQSQ